MNAIASIISSSVCFIGEDFTQLFPLEINTIIFKNIIFQGITYPDQRRKTWSILRSVSHYWRNITSNLLNLKELFLIFASGRVLNSVIDENSEIHSSYPYFELEVIPPWWELFEERLKNVVKSIKETKGDRIDPSPRWLIAISCFDGWRTNEKQAAQTRFLNCQDDLRDLKLLKRKLESKLDNLNEEITILKECKLEAKAIMSLEDVNDFFK
jgi:hypothetical protein